jgi:hypothetical protein
MLDQSKPSNAAAQAKLDVAPTEYRMHLRRAGFDPLPVSGKQVFLEGWSTKTNASENDIRLWGKLWPDWTNTGVLTRLAPAIDLDITNPEAAEAVEELVRERFEERGHILVRIGKAPKRAILLRKLEPFKKLSAGLIAPNGDTTQKIEILGNGQQLVVDGIHPETGLPYTWHGGEPGKIKLDELPDISADEARAFLEEAVELLVRDFGYRRDGKPAAGNGHATPANGATDAPGERADWNQLVANIHAGTALHDSTRDLAAGLIVKGLDASGTITVLRSLMHASSAERDARWRERLDDIPNLVNGAAGKFAKPAPEPITPFETFDAGNWEGVGIAPRRWTILNRIPAGEPGIISGDGGTGKTLLMLQACVARRRAAGLDERRRRHARPGDRVLGRGEARGDAPPRRPHPGAPRLVVPRSRRPAAFRLRPRRRDPRDSRPQRPRRAVAFVAAARHQTGRCGEQDLLRAALH